MVTYKMSTTPVDTPKPIPNAMNFLFGGTSGIMASCVLHPLNIIKNRMQLAGQMGEKTTASIEFADVMKNEGISGMYKGLSANLLRQATYTTCRFGVYNWLIDLRKSSDDRPVSFAGKVLIGSVSGMCGAVVGTPAELCLIRTSVDGRLPPAERRNYTHVGNALVRIVREEGVRTLWRGCAPTVYRACVVNATQLSTYSQLKEMILSTKKYEDGFKVHVTASMVAGIVTSVASVPIDIIKTRVQNMKSVNGVPLYKGSIDAFRKLVANEGYLALWNGFIPYYARLGPHTILTFVVLEQLQASYRKNYM